MSYTDEDLRLITEAIDCAWTDGKDAGSAAVDVVLALTKAGRLLPLEAEIHSVGDQFASEHSAHGVPGIADPLIQETGSDRELALIRVRAWRKSHPGTHRLMRRTMTTFVGPWREVSDAD